MILDKGKTAHSSQRLAMAAALAAVAGRTVEQTAGIPHLSDEALFGILLAVVAALPMLAQEKSQEEPSVRLVQNSSGTSRLVAPRAGAPVLRISLALILASVVLGFTLVKNASYTLAEYRATSAGSSLGAGQPGLAMQSINGAIALAPDVGRYHVIRASILDKVRSSTAAPSGKSQLALEAYRANGRAVEANPFDIYGRLNFAESALTLATLGQAGMGEEVIEEYRLLTSLQPNFWLSHFLLGRAYMEMGQPDRAVGAYTEAIKLDPLTELFYDRRAEAYGVLGEYSLAIEDYKSIIQLNPDNVSAYSGKAVALFSLSRLEEAVLDFGQIIKLHDESIAILKDRERYEEAANIDPALAIAYNNRGSAYYELGRIDRAVEDYDRAIQLSPRTAEFYANRAFAYELQNKNAKAQQDLVRAIQLGFTSDFLKRN